MPLQQSMKIEFNVPIIMRDGVTLYANVHRPDDDAKHPAILLRLPYGKDAKFDSGDGRHLTPQRYVRSGFVVVIQDCRGTGVSEGDFYPFLADPEDGYDTIEWIAVQPWCNGNVGMMGMSAHGGTQWAAAMTQPPHLKAICPGACSSSAKRGQFIKNSGVISLGTLVNWFQRFCASGIRKSNLSSEQKQNLRERMNRLLNTLPEQLLHLPITNLPAIEIGKQVGVPAFLSDWIEHIEDDQFWSRFWSTQDPLAKVVVPAFHICGWNDGNVTATLKSFQEMQERAGSDIARKNQKLLIGPWVHRNHDAVVADMDYGAAAAGTAIDVQGMQIRWHDYWLNGHDNGIMKEPPVKIFVMGENVWRDEYEWPLARTQYTPYYFHSGGSANSRFGDGVLSATPAGDEPPDVYLYDPRHPTPTVGGMDEPELKIKQVMDQERVERRSDVLVYTSPPLEAPLEVTGPIHIELFAASSAVDTDFTGKVVDVYPDGTAYDLGDGIVRARYRESLSNPKLIEPGKVYQYHIDLKPTSNVFLAGHRIRVQISSANFPKNERNLNTGHPIGQDAEICQAVQTIYHNREFCSHILLPIIPKL